MQGWLPLCCGDNWDLFTVKRKWIFTITARSRYRCSASPASISRIFSRKKLSYCMLKDMSFWNPIYVVFHSGFKLLKRAENRIFPSFQAIYIISISGHCMHYALSNCSRDNVLSFYLPKFCFRILISYLEF